jgi:hypothetical protein
MHGTTERNSYRRSPYFAYKPGNTFNAGRKDNLGILLVRLLGSAELVIPMPCTKQVATFIHCNRFYAASADVHA